MDADALKYTPKFESESPEQQFVNSAATRFEQIRQQPNYLEQMVVTAEGLGEEYVKGAVGALDAGFYDKDALTHHILDKDFGPLEKDPAQKKAYETAVAIARQAEEVKRALIYHEIPVQSKELSPVERILLVGSLALSQLTDTIYFEEWSPAIRESEIGCALAKMEDTKPGSSLEVLPENPLQTRWLTRRLKDPQGGVKKGNIELVHYRDSLSTVPEFISTLNKLAQLLEYETTTQGQNDYGYSNLFKAWSECLKSDPEHQKEAEDAMMVAWRQIDPEAPIFIVPWAEYDYGDPAGVAIAPSFRFGVKSTSAETQELIKQEEEVKASILRNMAVRHYSGSKAVEASDSVHAVWSGFGGGDTLFAPSSQVLPNDSDLQLQYGCNIMPNLAQQRRGMELRERYAQLVYPPEIEERLRALKFTLLEQSVLEMHAHELEHPAGVTKKGLDRLAKLANRFEEWKATLGGMQAQVQENDSVFAKRALATLLYASAAYIRFDGNYRVQGYANIARAVLTLSDSLGIFSYNDREGWKLDLDDEGKIQKFWIQVGLYVDWCASAYKGVEMAKPDDVEKVKSGIAKNLRNLLGYGDRSDEEDRIGTIREIKTELAFADLPKFTTRLPLDSSVYIERFNRDSTDGLGIILNGRKFVLPIANVGSEDSPVEIAYFDPSVDTELEEAGAQELARQFLALGGECFVGVSSSKSEPMFQRAVEIVEGELKRKVESMIVHRGKESDFSGPEYGGREPIQIHSITGDKYIALSRSQVVTIAGWNEQEKRKVIGDDVVSTGGTVRGLQDAITQAIGNHPPIPVAAVMEEVPLRVLPDGNLEWLGRVPLHHHPAIGTPVYKR